MSWPPVLPELKADLDIEAGDTSDDTALAAELAAAVAFVEHQHAGRYDFTSPPSGVLPVPGDTIELGTIRLAGRWFTRRRSPDGLISSGEFGTSRIPAVDVDIERQLRIGRFAPGVFA